MGRKHSKDGRLVGKYRKRNIERARCIHYKETGKKERLDENVET